MSQVFVVRTESSLDHEGSPDVYGIYAEEHLAHQAIAFEWPKAKKSKHDPNRYALDKYHDVYVEAWSVIRDPSEFQKVF